MFIICKHINEQHVIELFNLTTVAVIVWVADDKENSWVMK